MEVQAARNTGILEAPFEKWYIAVREKENRLYTDKQVEELPYIEPSHVHSNEWKVRKNSAERLIAHLTKKNRPLSILEAGCGNGWLCGRLAELPYSMITGIDVNSEELEQAKRVFGGRRNILFLKGSADEIVFQSTFDAIVFAASIQYFPSLEGTIRNALKLLNDGGEIHILDSFLYQQAELKAARERTQDYYHILGFPEMANFYFHHGIDELAGFNYKILFDPSALTNRIFSKRQVFPWICITPK